RPAERRHGRGARATPAHRTQLKETAELRAIRAEEIVVDDVGGAQGGVRDARRVPDEKGLVREQGRRAGHGGGHRGQELGEAAVLRAGRRALWLTGFSASWPGGGPVPRGGACPAPPGMHGSSPGRGAPGRACAPNAAFPPVPVNLPASSEQ